MKKTSCSSVNGLILGAVVCLLLVGQVARADFVYSEPTLVHNINSDSLDNNPQISRDGLELYMESNRDGGRRIWVSRRATTNDPWPVPAKLDAPLNSAAVVQNSASLSADGLELYFSESDTSNPITNSDIWVLTRANKDDPWDVPKNLGPTVNSGTRADNPCISADGLSLYFSFSDYYNSIRPEIRVSTRLSRDDPWGEPMNLGPNVNTNQLEMIPFISPDSLSLFFTRGFLNTDVFVSKRASITDPWGTAESFAPVNLNSERRARSVSFSSEDPTIYFYRDSDIWQVEVNPIVDFNGDAIVDLLDVFELLEHWGTTDNSLYDIAPLPLGDGIVNAKDLRVLADHMIENEMANDFNDL
jgi:hypothetical protein